MTGPSVLYVAEPTVAGVAQCIADWSAGLVARGWRVSLACPSTGWLADTCRAQGVTVYSWEADNAPQRGVARELRRLHDIVGITDPDVLHLNGAKAGFIGRLDIRGQRPTAYSPHSWSFDAAAGIKAEGALRWERLATRWTDAIIAVSEAEADAGRRDGIRGPYVIARNGIDLEALQPAPDRAALRASLGIQPDETAVVCVGRLHRQKGQDLLLAAWPSVAADDRRLYLVGSGPAYADLLAGNRRDDVRFVGEADRTTALAWMQAADVVVVPSRWEGMALVPLESLAMGTPVVASDVTGVREAVGHGDCGVVVPPDSAGILGQALNTWLAAAGPVDDAAARASRREWIAASFNIDTTVGIVDETLRHIIAARS